jgi:hypothetical protein
MSVIEQNVLAKERITSAKPLMRLATAILWAPLWFPGALISVSILVMLQK